MRFVEDQERVGTKRTEPLAKRLGVGIVDEEAMGDEKVRESGPRVHSEALLLADSLDVFAVEDFESQAKAAIEFRFPLIKHGGWAGDHDVLNPFPKKELGGDQAGFDGFSETDVVGDEEIDSGKAERLAEGFELVGVELDSGSERRLEEVGIGGCDAVPPEGVEERREILPGIEAVPPNRVPSLLGDDFGRKFGLPKDGRKLALGGILKACQFDGGAVGSPFHRLDDVGSRTDVDHVASRRWRDLVKKGRHGFGPKLRG